MRGANTIHTYYNISYTHTITYHAILCYAMLYYTMRKKLGRARASGEPQPSAPRAAVSSGPRRADGGWLYMYVCIYIYIYIIIYNYIIIHLSIFLSFYLAISLSLYLSLSISISLSLSLSLSIYIYIYIHAPARGHPGVPMRRRRGPRGRCSFALRSATRMGGFHRERTKGVPRNGGK